MAIVDPAIEPEVLVAQVGLQRIDQFAGFGRRDLAGSEALHRLVFDGDQIAACGPIVRSQLDPLGGGLDGGAGR